jgi:porin
MRQDLHPLGSRHGRTGLPWLLLLLLTLCSPSPALPWQETAESDSPLETHDQALEASTGPNGEPPSDPEDTEGSDATEESGEEDSERKTKSGYDDIPTAGGPTTVESDLIADDLLKRPVFRVLSRTLEPLYRFKNRVDGLWGIAFGMDYNFLNQYASFSFTEDQATSGNFRFYGTWNLFHSKEKIDGRLVYRIENRHTIGGGITPRDLGFDAGSALSTASFKDFAWGITALYWKQFFAKRKFAFVFGQMDPGDFMDAYPLLSAWTAFMSDAFFNNPAEALPQQGVGFVARLFVSDHFYAAGGVHDALADADGFNVAELFDGEDLFYWVEAGWAPSKKSVPGDSIHVTYWVQDELEEKGTERSRGLAFSAARQVYKRYQPFLRIGYSEGDAALMRWLWALGLGLQVRDSDLFGIATSYGAPVELDTDPQVTSEVFYRLQFTDHLQITPALQVTHNPSFNDVKDTLYVGSVLRMRLAF